MPIGSSTAFVPAVGVDALAPATGKRYEVRDDLVVGLMLRVSHTGGKSGI